MNPRVRELEKQLHSASGDTTRRVDILNALFWEIWPIDPKRGAQYATEGLELAQKIAYAKGLAFAKCNLGIVCYSRAQIEQATTNLLDALQWFEENAEPEGQANANHGLAFLYWGFGDFQRGFDSIFKTVNLYEQLNDCDGKAWAFNTLGGFYYDWKDFRQSREYYRKARGIFKDTQNRTGEARALNGLGNAYHFLGEENKALAYQRKSLKIYQSLGNILGASRTLNDMGFIYQSLEQYEKALEYHNKSLEIRQGIGYPQGEASCLLDIGNVYLKENKLQAALEVFQEALLLSEKIKAKLKTCQAHLALYQIYKQLGQPEKALEHHEQFHTIDEEVYHEDNEQKLQNLKAAYSVETSKKEAEIYRLKNVELKTKNEELQQTLKKLHAMQAQLIQSGKMVALGQLVAGIAHEINTPVGAIKSAADVVDRVNVKLQQMLDADETLIEVKHNKHLASVFDILQQNSEITVAGANRILRIIDSLKNFSRLDEADFQKVDIHQGLESTMTLIEHGLKNGIRIIREYGDVPEIYSYPSELNQVFMNLLMNGIQAMDGQGTLTIRTYCADRRVYIEFSDTGKGIPQEKIEGLFEPGFTEKQSQVRMRTGLYTSYSIILKHKGDIKVESELGKGTTFTISIPENLNEA
ncbi:MAG: tetratricopeptide repeat protein [bacterium]